ncbi:tRNA (guanine37-N(1)-) methyltransferase [Balneicella halophila]|uniref:tRNA (guanine-N(1)-)-methyltransferase n=1 Tax=Balneicella halophila TaxID=1537566 RepID=A0A7L4UPH2_BALHA|nr:tRNA (guanosine(37)-N1)-methyltransferase TrmD [Balneicella halophila]PVX51008.1 tRNA (guanine37-N(1)-) methyltransferase [Balneicella halophila]
MRIDILSAVPNLLDSFFNNSILKRAQDKGIAELYVHDLRDYTLNKHRKVDDYPYGGEGGMVMSVEPIDRAITYLKSQRDYDHVIYTSPDGKVFNQKLANTLSLSGNIIILCGHYKGIDHRIREHLITMEISIGDFVMTGGELAAAVITDSIIRLLPGAISDECSALSDSFQDDLLSHPIYTRPAEYKGWKVPEVLLGGDHEAVSKWQEQQALERTKKLRPDLLE